jgi:hypothetical protein
MLSVISSPARMGWTTRTISAFWLTLWLNSGVRPKQISRESRMQITPTTVRFFKKLILAFPP